MPGSRPSRPNLIRDPAIFLTVARMWGTRCVYCGGRAHVLDHLLPVSRGGSDDPINLAPSCNTCNSAKGCRTPGEYLAHRVGCRVDALTHPSGRPLSKRIYDARKAAVAAIVEASLRA